MHRSASGLGGRACKMDDGEFEFVYHFLSFESLFLFVACCSDKNVFILCSFVSLQKPIEDFHYQTM